MFKLTMGGAAFVSDFVLISASWLLDQKVTTYDASGNGVPDDGSYQRHGADAVFVFAEFMKSQGLLIADADVSRRPDLELRFSQLTEQGQKFARFALDKWMTSVDRAGLNKTVTDEGLKRLWTKFSAKSE